MGHPSRQEDEAASSSAVVIPSSLSRLDLRIVSYGHSNGPLSVIPGAAQLTFSVRDVANPPARLRKTHTGLSSRLRNEIMADRAAAARLHQICTVVEEKMSQMAGIGQTCTLLVGIMCEEGKHRSVAFAEELARRIDVDGWEVSVEHRDLGVGSNTSEPQKARDSASDKETEPSLYTPKLVGRIGKRQREQQRRRGRSLASKFVSGHLDDDDDDAHSTVDSTSPS